MDNAGSQQQPIAFGLLHRKIQEELYAMRWTNLRPIQVDSIRGVITSDKHIIVSAKTAGGKTEAAFLPILSKICESEDTGVKALYVGPLKALINDQFRRLEELCKRAEIPVFKWHGDVTGSSKKEFLKIPKGVLLITPESIESMFVNRSNRLNDIFGQLEFIVIDEMHSFIGVERGAHLKSLISRLSQMTRYSIRLIGLSATLGDMDLSRKWLLPRESENISLISDEGEDKSLKFRLHGYLTAKKPNTDDTKKADIVFEHDEAGLDDFSQGLLEDLYNLFKGKTALIFGNNKAKLESYANQVMLRSRQHRDLHQFSIHHGSLSKAIREDAEEELKSDRPTAVFCSTTLEMGIDVGNVSIVGQIDCPWSVSSVSQRIGRSGRHENQPSIMRMFVEELEPDAKTGLIDRLHKNFLQALAMSELMFEKWCEPPEINRFHFSTLIQQILSLIAEHGGATADNIFDMLVTRGSFTNIGKRTFIKVLRVIGEKDLIEQTPEKTLILGLVGEKIVNKFDFYSAFKTSEELRVIHNGKNIGSIWQLPIHQIDSYLILAGKRWKILDVNPDRKEITVTPSRSGRLPFFPPAAGPDVHPKVRQKMHDLLFSEDEPIYLDPTAKKILTYARNAGKEAGIQGRPFLQIGPDVIWFTWTGSRINLALWGLAHYYGEFTVADEDIALVFEKVSIEKVRDFFLNILKNPPSETELASNYKGKSLEKYDSFLSEELLDMVYGNNSLALEDALNLLDSIDSG